MLHKKALTCFAGFLLFGSSVFAQELATNSRKHSWSRIAYPAIECNWGIDQTFLPSIQVKANQGIWGFELLIKGPKEQSKKEFGVPIPSECEVSLHTADGRIRRPVGDLVVVKEWNRETQEWTARATCSFPWTRNEFDEAWIELRTADDVYYFEMPYGFTRDPGSELCLPSPKGYPELVDSIQPLERGSHVIWWHHVEYDFGEVEPGWQMLLWISNPFDMKCSVLFRPLAERRELPTNLSNIKVKLRQAGGWDMVANQLLGSLYPDAPDLSIDSMESNFSRNPNANERRWGEFDLSLGDRTFTTVVPSSLFHYVHGVSDYYRHAEKTRSKYGPQSIDPRIPFYRPGKEPATGSIRIGGCSELPFLPHSFNELYAELKINAGYEGNAKAVHALVSGDADLVILTRQLTTDETDQFEKNVWSETNTNLNRD